MVSSAEKSAAPQSPFNVKSHAPRTSQGPVGVPSEQGADRQNYIVIGGVERCRGDLEPPTHHERETVVNGKPAEYDAGCDVEQRASVV